MIGFGENIGSGFPTILDSCRQEHWKKPVLSDDTILNEVSLTLKFPVAEKREQVKVTEKVTETQQKIIEAIKSNPYLTQTELADIIGISRMHINKNMAKLQNKGLVRHIGSDKGGHWEIIEK